jgi:hypothetical protein
MPDHVTARYRARDGTEHLVTVGRTPEGAGACSTPEQTARSVQTFTSDSTATLRRTPLRATTPRRCRRSSSAFVPMTRCPDGGQRSSRSVDGQREHKRSKPAVGRQPPGGCQ